MEVTRKTFSKQLPAILSQIEQASFISIDGEFSGLLSAKSKAYNVLDDMQERYDKVRDSASIFTLLQFGMTIFTKTEGSGRFDVKPYSFYLFSDTSSFLGLERRLTFQASSATFLAQNNFDFNKVFHDGIPYLSRQEEDAHRNKRSVDTQIVTLKPEDEEFVNSTFKLVDEWYPKTDEPSLKLPPCNSFQRLLLYQQAKVRYGTNVALNKSVENGNTFLTVYRGENQEVLVIEESQLQEMIGFRQVIDKLFASKRTLIGHNCLLDLCHVMKFVGRLPDDVYDFKRQLNTALPDIYDTKLLATNLLELQSTHLGDLYSSVKSESVDSRLEFESGYAITEQLHDAAYDSFVTGYCYLAMTEKDVTPFMNKLFIMKSDYDHMDIVGTDSVPDRSNLYYMTFPKEWKTSDIHNAFGSEIKIIWIDDVSVYIKSETELSTTADAAFTLVPYTTYKKKKLI